MIFMWRLFAGAEMLSVAQSTPFRFFFTASAVAFLVGLAPATAATIPISLSESHFGLPDFYTLDTTFNLPSGFSNATLGISTFSADDRAVLTLNGTIVASTGIFGPGNGSMVLTSGGSNDPFFFIYGNTGPFASITSGFTTGLNTLSMIVNDTNTGITGNLSGGFNCGFPNCEAPTSASFIGEVTYDSLAAPLNSSAAPLPATLPLCATGLGVLGLLGWRRKRKAKAFAS
jgi:hypothetical protein